MAARIDKYPDLVKNRGRALRVLAGRPLYFYLVLNGANPVRLLEEGSSLLKGPGTTGELGVWDMLQPLGVSSDGTNKTSVFSRWQLNRQWSVRLDPVTLLDHAPEAVFMDDPLEFSFIKLLGPFPYRTLDNVPDGETAP